MNNGPPFFGHIILLLINQNGLDYKTLDVALCKDKTIKVNLSNYVKGTNATGICVTLQT